MGGRVARQAEVLPLDTIEIYPPVVWDKDLDRDQHKEIDI